METLMFDYAGMNFRVKADIEDGQVEMLYQVEVAIKDDKFGKYARVEVAPFTFLETMKDVLSEAIEENDRDLKLARADMLIDQAKEEGKR